MSRFPIILYRAFEERQHAEDLVKLGKFRLGVNNHRLEAGGFIRCRLQIDYRPGRAPLLVRRCTSGSFRR